MKLVVFTSALNEADTIGKVLDAVPTKITGITEIVKLVVDDGSTDNTAQVAAQHGALVLSNGRQKRLAYSFGKAANKALELGADIAVNIDADMQFNPKQIPDLIKPILENKADFVVGDRFTDPKTGLRRKPENMPSSKYLSNRLGSWIVGVLSGQSFRDVTCGFRAYNRHALLMINLNGAYTYTQESFQVLAINKVNIISFPVEVTYFPGRKSRVVTSFFGFLFGSAINIIKAFRDNQPLKFFGVMGGVMIIIGLIPSIFVLLHFLATGSFSPYIFMAFSGAYFITLGLITWILGLVADMLDRIRSNQEKMLYLLKEIRYGEYKHPTKQKN